MTDEQDRAEALDEDVVTDDDDRTGDLVGESLPDFPPDRPLAVGTVGLTAVEEDAGESFAERTWREEPEEGDEDRRPLVGQLADPDAATEDREEEAIGEELGAIVDASPEERALHIEEETG